MRRSMARLVIATTLFAAVALTGCACGGRTVDIVDMRTETFEIPADSVDRAVIDLDLGIGELKITGGATGVCSGTFQYNVAEWEPVVESRSDQGSTVVRITQPSVKHRSVCDEAESIWTLELSDSVPAHLVVDIGVGESKLTLDETMVERVDLDAGVGEITIDASDVHRNLDINVDSGVGSVILFVPDDVSVLVDCDRGIGTFDYSGLTPSHGYHVNGVYGETEQEITVRVDAGVGEIRVIAGDRTASI